MDLHYYGRVFSRFRWLIVGGVILAIVLAFLSFAKVSSKGITYREKAVYESTATMLLTQGGKTFADPTKFSALTDLYSALANSDQVRATMLRDGAEQDVEGHGVARLAGLEPRGYPAGHSADRHRRLGC